MDLTWTASTDAVGVEGYNVYRDSVQIDTTATNSYSATGLTANTSYAWKVEAYDLAGNVSTQSGTLNQATSSPTDSTAPTFGGLTGSSYDAQNNITLSWTQGTDSVTSQGNLRYRVYRSTSSGVFDYTSPMAVDVIGVGSVVLSGMEYGTYYFVVRCEDESGNRDTNTTQRTVTLPSIAPRATRSKVRFTT